MSAEPLNREDWLRVCGELAEVYAAAWEAADAEIAQLRETLAGAYVQMSGRDVHASDCATSNAPAMTPGACDCDELSGRMP